MDLKMKSKNISFMVCKKAVNNTSVSLIDVNNQLLEFGIIGKKLFNTLMPSVVS